MIDTNPWKIEWLEFITPWTGVLLRRAFFLLPRSNLPVVLSPYPYAIGLLMGRRHRALAVPRTDQPALLFNTVPTIIYRRSAQWSWQSPYCSKGSPKAA